MGEKYNKDKGFSIAEDSSERRVRQCVENDSVDAKFGFERMTEQKERTGFLINMHTTEIIDEDKRLHSAVDYYFIEEDGTRFKVSYPYQPYFYVLTKKDTHQEVSKFLMKKYNGIVDNIQTVTKEDLDLPNHLVGLKQRYLKLSFLNITDLLKVRREMLAAVRKAKERAKTSNLYSEMLNNDLMGNDNKDYTKKIVDQFDNIVDIREFDVPYHIRVSIDNKIFIGCWYTIKPRGQILPPFIVRRIDLIETPDVIVLAFDIECTKQPLKFPDSETDQIIMISYMIDGQGYLINNREIMSQDVDDFEYTPTPEFEGNFIVYNEPNEKSLLRRFFDHIIDIKPHVIVTYNGDFFDWPFVEDRASFHALSMKNEIGFSKAKDGVYSCRPITHMDCLCWVKRDSYLPVGSHNLKAVAKAKLRYDPVELDPEDMCRLAAEEPQVLANYSVSDAVATYYLYMKYVHPFIFALCTIIPMEPDEVLRKGSGTLCETLLMVEAFHANIIFPNKQEPELNKMTSDGHVLNSETYIGGHVEALESGVFRADIPCRFRLVPEMFDKLIEGVEKVMTHAIEKEEKIPLAQVTNMEEVIKDIKEKLVNLRDNPVRTENPVIYHLDVGAMYPNIILTNRLQPYAVVNEEICAACDFNRAGATCQRRMVWMWRGELMPATRSEFQRIQQQLETEKFPPEYPGGPPRAFHQLSKEEQAEYEKKRLTEYCRKAYKKIHVTRVEEIESTICQMENSFYVDTVRAFRDRRYEYKGLSKFAKRQVSDAIAKGDAREIKSAKNREVLYDSLQLAHKCILNSFYGYVMRRGARWFSMEMAGIVCNTGAAIITKAREIIEQVGRPLELDTDGIWCVLPKSFPENFEITTNISHRKKVTVSYPNAVLNCMVQDHFTNHQYHELVDPDTLKYVQRSENSIFFEVDGPYLAMVLPASKEEGKKLKKRYAVFNFDKSLAELKGFEVKRRGELQLIKIFQSSVFEAFLKGNTLEKCYEAVAKVADYWLDVLYSKAYNLPDAELFDLISENRSMSKKLEDYGAQKSTSISTAKRLAEFLGDQMIKDKGLACRYIISRKPEGSPVTERAIPLAIFQAEPSIKRHYLRKWLKDNSITDVDIRQVLDWNYYIERLNGAIQKIITIPAALQGLNNPVPRVRHPDWLHKKILEKNDVLKQRKMNEFFTTVSKEQAMNREVRNEESVDIEDTVMDGEKTVGATVKRPICNKRKRDSSIEFDEDKLQQDWRTVLGPPPAWGKTKEEIQEWIKYHKRKWEFQRLQRNQHVTENPSKRGRVSGGPTNHVIRKSNTLGGFIKKAQRTILESHWHVIQFAETAEPGLFKVWALVEKELHIIKLHVPRIFYVNQRTQKDDSETNRLWKKASRLLPRSRPVFYLYEYSVPESLYREHGQELMTDLSTPEIEGIYETQVPLEFRVLLLLENICSVDRSVAQKLYRDGMKDTDSFTMDQLSAVGVKDQQYLQRNPDGSLPLKTIFLYHHRSSNSEKAFYGVFLGPSKRAVVYVQDTVKTNQMPNLSTLYATKRASKITNGTEESDLPPADIQIEAQVMTDKKQIYRLIQKFIQSYKDEKKGPTVLLLQSFVDTQTMVSLMPTLSDFPIVTVHSKDPESLFSDMQWQKIVSKYMIERFMNSEIVFNTILEQCRYFRIPIGNLPADATLFGADLFYGRCLLRNNFVLWCSQTDLPDLGGRESDDGRLLTDFDESSTPTINKSGCYSTVVVELDVESLAVNTLMQSHRVNEIEGTSSSVAFDVAPQVSVDEMIGGHGPILTSYDETALCSPAFRVIRAMVNSWLRDVSVGRNIYADYQVVHFYRWLRSPNALFYDPALRRTLLTLMKKLFFLLIGEFRRLGAVTVFANFNKIIICTKKHSVSDAIGYVDFVVTSIRNKELFHSIQITFNRSWVYLMWLDIGNYAGIRGKIPKGLTDGLSDGVVAEEEDEGGNRGEEEGGDKEEGGNGDEEDDEEPIVMNWTLARYLPSALIVQKNFIDVIAVYINTIWPEIKKESHGPRTPNKRRMIGSQSQIPATPMGIGVHESVKEYARNFIEKELSLKLFSLTQKIHNKTWVANNKSDAPRLDDGNGQTSPALEFIKAVCKVLSLDDAITDEVASLKRNMLKLIKVGEFSDIAAWSDPCVTIILPEIICKVCNHCRDIDLCKDEHRIELEGMSFWQCPVCQSKYDNKEIEHILLDTIQRKSMAYTLQDLQCKKCLEIKADNLREYCDCAGEFKTLIPSQNVGTHLKILKVIGHQFSMPLLCESVEWMLKMNPSFTQQ